MFSLFEGKRFDLGLYEAGLSRNVTFSVPGVHYIFCNIHPEMNAVVVTVDVEHYATSAASGAFSIARPCDLRQDLRHADPQEQA